MQEIRRMIDKTDSDYDKEKWLKRLARLVSGVAVIKGWCCDRVEMKNSNSRLEDALNSTRAAVEGCVPGGGVALLKAAKTLDTLKGSK